MLETKLEVIYLDFDGVLHPHDAAFLVTYSDDLKIEGEDLFRWIPILEEILDGYPNVKIVVHSSWRNHYFPDEIKEILGPDLGSRFVGVTNREGANRYENILLDSGSRGFKEIAILDDDSREFPSHCFEWIRCKKEIGISDPMVQQAIKNFLNPPILSLLHTIG